MIAGTQQKVPCATTQSALSINFFAQACSIYLAHGIATTSSTEYTGRENELLRNLRSASDHTTRDEIYACEREVGCLAVCFWLW